MGPDSSLAALILAVPLPLSAGDPARAVALAGAMAVAVGLIGIVAGLAKLGLERGPGPTSSPVMQVLRQVALCPPAFPRRDGLPAKRPLF
jgi:flagellar biogenesis protein FliO